MIVADSNLIAYVLIPGGKIRVAITKGTGPRPVRK